jgi:tRNA(Ile)-lysidine synthase
MEPLLIIEKARQTISRHRMLAPGDSVIAAVSGGPDSMCLLAILRELAPRFRAALTGVAHVNHKLRGIESDNDERFVANVATGYGIPFHRSEACVSEELGNLEEAARRARQKFFERLMQDGAGNRVATGHTLHDQAETVLFRILRGAGPSGIAGILPVTPQGLIRPLLDVTRTEVEQYLRSRDIAWRHDASNRDLRFARNRIRHSLLPQLAREWNPRIWQVLARTAHVASEEEIWWESEIRRIAGEVLFEVEGGIEAQAAKMASLPKALARRLIRRFFAGLDFDHVERILELAAGTHGEGSLDLPGLTVMRSLDWLRFEATAPLRLRLSQAEATPSGSRFFGSIALEIPGRYRWGNGYICVAFAEPKQCQGNCASLKIQGLSELSSLELRRWRAGDRYRPALGSREYTIQELFQRARVPSWRRDAWPIISMGPKILWVRQFGAAADFVAGNEAGAALRIWEESGK